MKIRNLILAALVAVSSVTVLASTPQKIDLAGEWMFRIDRHDQGEQEKWFLGEQPESVMLPGSMSENGKGDQVTLQTPWTGQIVDSSWFKEARYAPYRTADNTKIPAWLQPVKYYKGAAWYIRDITLGAESAYLPLELLLERPHWETTIWVDGQKIGTQNSLGTPHRYTVPPLKAGNHRVAIRVDNRIKDIDMGYNAHSVSDHTQSNWNGIVGELSLTPRPAVSITRMELYPDIDKSLVRVKVITDNRGTKPVKATINLAAKSRFAPSLHAPASVGSSVTLSPGVDILDVDYPMEDFYKWDEFTPYYYSMNASLTADKSIHAARSDFGMRKFEAQGRALHINGRKIFLRGTLECAIFPDTGYPAMGREEWARIFHICKEHGLNHVRFHSWCPPRAAFEAADRAGVYLQVEGGGWAKVGDGNGFDKWIYAESDRILAEYGNHPSFMLYTYGNEPDGGNQAQFLGGLVDYLKAKDSRRLYTSAAGWPAIEQNQYRNDMYPRLKVWGSPSPLNAQNARYDYQFDEMISKCDVPWVSHEIGQWCVYPDFKEIDRYEDALLQAKNFEIFRETLDKAGMAHLAESFLMASGKLQTMLYKAEIEAALRTRDFAGFQLLDLHDFPGQGTALVGVLNPFWESKGYVTASEYRRFSGATVPLIRLDRVIFHNDQTAAIPVEVAHYGQAPLMGVVPTWRITRSNGEIYSSGALARQNIMIGNCQPLGVIEQPLSASIEPEKLTVTVTIPRSGGVTTGDPEGENSWDIWVYPAASSGDGMAVGAEKLPRGVRVCDTLDAKTIKFIEDGGSVLLAPRRGTLAAEVGGDVKTGFSTIFWNSAWTRREQPPLTLGLLCNPTDAALADFPTEYHSNFQWADAVTNASVVDLARAGAVGVEPAVRVIDDWFENRPLGLIFEARVGKGKLLFSGVDLSSDMENRPASCQLRSSLIKYLCSDGFAPRGEIKAETLARFFNWHACQTE